MTPPAVCPFCGTAQRTRRAGAAWPFRRHTLPGRGAMCPGSASVFPVPNVWTTLTHLHQLRQEPTVEITITRTALAADIVPGFTIRHPDTGAPSTVERTTLDVGGKVTFAARHPGAGRRHTITMGTDHEVDVLPAAHEEAGIWEAIGEAVSRANAAFHGEAIGSAENRPPGARAPWTRLPGVEPGTLEIAAVGHRWNLTADPTGEPAEDPEG